MKGMMFINTNIYNSKKRHLVTAITKCHKYHDQIDQVTTLLYHGNLKNQTQNSEFDEKSTEEREDIS